MFTGREVYVSLVDLILQLLDGSLRTRAASQLRL